MTMFTGNGSHNLEDDGPSRRLADNAITAHVISHMRHVLRDWIAARTEIERSFYLGEFAYALNELAKHNDEWAGYMARWDVMSDHE